MSGTGGVVVVQPTRTNRVRMNRAAFGQLDEEVIMQNIGDAAVPQEYADLLLRIEEKDKRFVASRNFVRTQLPQSNQNTAGKRRRGRRPQRKKRGVLPAIFEGATLRMEGHGEGDFDYDGGEQAYREALERFENDDDNLRHIGFVDDRGNKWAEMGSDQKRTDEAWPVAMRWSIFHSCHENEALCAYATLCPWCIFAETMAKLGKGTFEAHLCLTGTLFCGFPSSVVRNVINIFPFGLCIAPLFNPVPCISMNSRILLARGHGLDKKECGSPCCAHYWCGPCATYQEALFVERELGPFESPIYVTCFKWWEDPARAKAAATFSKKKAQTRAAQSTIISATAADNLSPHKLGRNVSRLHLQPDSPERKESPDRHNYLNSDLMHSTGSLPIWIDDDPAYGSP